MRRLLLLTLALGAMLTPSRWATGQTTLPSTGSDPATAPQTVLHEYVPDGADLKELLDLSARTGAGKLPSGFNQQGSELPKPRDGVSPRPAEPTMSRRGSQRDRQTSMDRETTHEGTLHYHVVFNPSVVPFKRVSVLDAASSSFDLYARDPSYREIPLRKITNAPDRTYFWGSLLLRARRGERIPIPSVAPGMVVHGYETVPAGVGVRFYRDGTDSFAASLSRTRRRRVRVRLLVSAPTRYFSYGIPAGLTLADVPSARRPSLHPKVRRVAARMIARLGISESDPLKVVLDKLVAHFRAFEEGPLAISTGNTYADLTISQRGVCRHRSYAFVITALALGLPARYVTNEAHAFVEVWIPRLGWIRLDLGGAASQMRVTGAKGRRIHRPLEDPFPKPLSYSQGYTRLSGAVTGLSPAQRRGPLPRSGHGAIRNGQVGGITSSGSRSVAPTARKIKAGVAVLLSVESARTTGLRGDPLTVLGTVSNASGAPLAGRPVELLLRRPGSKSLVILGETISGHHGRFKLVTTIPLAAQVGTYQVVAYSPADRRHQAGWSN